MKKMNSLDKKKLTKRLTGYGIVALVIVTLIFLNAILTIVGDKNNWYTDMTKTGLYTVSDELTDLLDETDLADSIEIIFCCDEDYAKEHYTNLQSGQALAYVHSTAVQIADRYEEVSISYRDVRKEPTFFKENFQEIERFLSGITDPIIIAKKGIDGKYGTHFKVYAARGFYGFATEDGSLYAYNGEAVFASALLSLSHIEVPTVYFTTKHGEVLTSSVSSNAPSQLWATFQSCGFDVAELDLTTTKIPDNASLIVINQPESDFDHSEITAIDKYLDTKGNVMFFANPDFDHNYTNLYSLLEARAGIVVNNESGNDLITDPSTNVLGDDFSFKAEHSGAAAANTYLSYLKNASSARPYFTNSTSITIKPDYLSSEGYYDMKNHVFTQPLFNTTSKAIKDGEDGVYTVMSMTAFTRTIDGVDGALPHEEYSYLMFVPSSGFASDEALSQVSNPNKDILLSITHVITSAQTPVNISYKVFENTDLDITEKQAKTTTTCLIVIPTLVAILTGAVIIFRRKRR